MKNFSFYGLFLLLITLISCNDAEVSPYPDIAFTQKAGIPNGGRSSAVAFVIGDKAYIALGRSQKSTKQGLTDCWQYTPATDSWTQKADFPGLGRVNAIAETVNGKAYVGLGYNPQKSVYSDGSILTDLWAYDPGTDSWEQKAFFPTPADGSLPPVNSCFSFVVDSFIYIGANFNAHSFLDQFWRYNTLTDTWEQINKLPMRNTASVSCTDGSRYFSGTGYGTLNDNRWWEYFPSSDSWKQRRDMPDNGRLNAVALSVDHRFFVATGLHFGGTMTGGHLFSDILEYDATKDVWYRRGSMSGGKRQNAICFVINGTGYIGFGENDSEVLNDLWSFEP